MPYILRDVYGHEFPVGPLLRIGSDPSPTSVQLRLNDPQVEPVHATLWEQQGALFLRDENTRAGTFVNRSRVQQVSLHPGDQVTIGSAVLTVAYQPEAQPLQPRGPAYSAPSGSRYPPGYVAPTPPKKSGRGWLVGLLIGCAGIIGLCLVVGVAGYFAYQAGIFTPAGIANLIGIGPGYVEIDNFRDDSVQITIQAPDTSNGTPSSPDTLEIKSFDVHSYTAQQPGVYRVDFGSTSGGSELGSCTLTVKSGDHFQFVALPDNILINRVNNPPAQGPDLVVKTSSLCR
jgi:hypothetical protein